MTIDSRHNRSRIHRAWWVALVTFLALLAAASFRSSTGALFAPIEHTFGWSRGVTASSRAARGVLRRSW